MSRTKKATGNCQAKWIYSRGCKTGSSGRSSFQSQEQAQQKPYLRAQIFHLSSKDYCHAKSHGTEGPFSCLKLFSEQVETVLAQSSVIWCLGEPRWKAKLLAAGNSWWAKCKRAAAWRLERGVSNSLGYSHYHQQALKAVWHITITHTSSAQLCLGRAGQGRGMKEVSLLWVLFRKKELFYYHLMSKTEKKSPTAFSLCFTRKL